MKRILVWVGFFALLPFAAAQRLPELALPENYKLSFAPDFQKDNFEGEETISVRVLKTTPEIVLNSAEIEFQEATISSGETTQQAKITLDRQKETATLAFSTPVNAGPAKIHIKYTGILNNELRGLYLGKDRDGRKYAVTQFEATDARRAFPSFDEPGYKATFDVSAVAMENTGFITYRQAELQLDDQHASVELRKRVAVVIAHEMAHQWFGDLVTMRWWDDIWLNEGFASWMETKAVGAWKPEWHFELEDVEDTTASLNSDSLRNTRPIHQAAETPAEIQELFDGIAYDKAASVLRMLEAYLGPERFRAGVNQYLTEHSYGNATADDFWRTLAKLSKEPVDKIMPTFVQQPGAPMVSVRTQCLVGSTVVTLSQRRYFSDRRMFEAGSKELWQVPVCVKESGEGETGHEKCVLLTRKEESVTLPGCGSWVMANAGAHGYYRSGYSSDAIRAMGRSLEHELTQSERIVLLGDSWASVRVGEQQIGDYLALAEGLRSDRTRAVLSQVTAKLEYISNYLVSDADRQEYEQWVRRLLTPVAAELGWQPKAGESDETKSLRARVLHTLGYAGRDPDAIAKARQLTERALQDPASIDSTVAFTAFSLAAENGDAILYDKVMTKLQSRGSSLESYYLYFQTLSKFHDPKLLRRTLDYAISPAVRSQDTLGMIAAVMRNPAGAKLAWDFVRMHWPEIEKIGGGFTSAEVVAATGVFCDAEMHEQVRSFFAQHDVPTAERTLKLSLESIHNCTDLKSQQTPELSTWLQQKGSASGK